MWFWKSIVLLAYVGVVIVLLLGLLNEPMRLWLHQPIRFWTSTAMLAGLGVVIVLLLGGDWLRTWWTTNLLRNRLEAKRRLRREGRQEDQP